MNVCMKCSKKMKDKGTIPVITMGNEYPRLIRYGEISVCESCGTEVITDMSPPHTLSLPGFARQLQQILLGRNYVVLDVPESHKGCTNCLGTRRIVTIVGDRKTTETCLHATNTA